MCLEKLLTPVRWNLQERFPCRTIQTKLGGPSQFVCVDVAAAVEQQHFCLQTDRQIPKLSNTSRGASCLMVHQQQSDMWLRLRSSNYHSLPPVTPNPSVRITSQAPVVLRDAAAADERDCPGLAANELPLLLNDVCKL